MKNISLLLLLLVLTFGASNTFGQTAKPATKRKLRTIIKPVPKPKIETEDWKVFDGKDWKLKIAFPKKPTLTVTDKVSFEPEAIKSSIAQTYINGGFYMIEVRQYPENFLPDKMDLGADYGDWMKTFILSDVKIVSEKTYSYEYYKIVEFVYQQTENDVLIHRALVVGKNLYQMIIQLEIKKPDKLEQAIAKNEERIKRFFDSFEITEKNLDGSTIY